MTVSNKQQSLLAIFTRWYFYEAPRSILCGYAAYALAFAEIFPFIFLLRTLLSPWKNISDRTLMHGIDLEKIAEKLSLGLLARLVGCVVRLLTIILGLLFEILILLTTVFILAAWFSFPVLLFLGTSYCIRSL